MYHYIYRITNIITGSYYIGCHSSKSLDDNYYGSGVRLKRSIAKYGIENFKKEILVICKDREEKFAVEKQLITEELLNDPLCLNLGPGGKGGTCPGEKASFYGRKHKPETIEKMREKGKNRVIDPKIIENFLKHRPDASGKNNPMYGKFGPEHPAYGTKRPHLVEYNTLRRGLKRGPDSLETRKKKSEAQKGRISPMLGKKHSEETIEKIRKSAIRLCDSRIRENNGKFISMQGIQNYE